MLSLSIVHIPECIIVTLLKQGYSHIYLYVIFNGVILISMATFEENL